jgi:putative transposase
MRRSRFTEGQIAYVLRQAEHGTSVTELCRKMGVSQQTFYLWKKRFSGMGVAEVRRLKELEEENRRLKRLVADLTVDKQMLQDVLAKNREACGQAATGGLSRRPLPSGPAASLQASADPALDVLLPGPRARRCAHQNAAE